MEFDTGTEDRKREREISNEISTSKNKDKHHNESAGEREMNIDRPSAMKKHATAANVDEYPRVQGERERERDREQRSIEDQVRRHFNRRLDLIDQSGISVHTSFTCRASTTDNKLSTTASTMMAKIITTNSFSLSTRYLSRIHQSRRGGRTEGLFLSPSSSSSPSPSMARQGWVINSSNSGLFGQGEGCTTSKCTNEKKKKELACLGCC